VRRAIIALSVIVLLASPVRGALPIRIDLTPSGDTLDQGSDPYGLPLAHLSVSADGRFVTIGPYVRELATGAIDRYAIDVDGTPITAFGAGESNIISADGRYVLFLGTQYYPVPRLLLRDRLLQQTVELPIGVGGPIVGYVFGVQLSSDGGLVTFHANGTNLPGDAPYAQVYAHDIVSGVTELVSVPAGGGTPNGESYWADPSDDGQYVLFLSEASNLVLGVSGSQLYIRDRLAGTTELVSRNSSGEPSTGTYGSARVSSDGRWVAFNSGGDNLDPTCDSAAGGTYLHDRVTGETECVSVSTTGVPADGSTFPLAVGPDGGRVLFAAPAASNLVAGDPRPADLYVRDRVAGTTVPHLRMPTVGGFAPLGISAQWDKIPMRPVLDRHIPAAGAAFLVDLTDSPPCTGGVAILRARVTITKLGSAVGEQQLKLSGQLSMPPGAFDPAGRGVQVSVADAGSANMRFYDFTAQTIPIGPAGVVAGCAASDGWRAASATVHKYRNVSGALLANGCVAGTARGLTQIALKDQRASRGIVVFSARAKQADLPQTAGPLQLTVVLGADPAAGAAGECGTHVFSAAECIPSRGGTALRCKS
jgi:hypothetical protein